jgi:Ca-activated chloride channel family protein
MRFDDPLALLLLLLIALYALYRKRRNALPAIPFPSVTMLEGLPVTLRHRLSSLLPLLWGLAMLALVAALARPQLPVRTATVTTRGVDLALALDLSTSMLAVDRGEQPRGRSRLAIAKEITREFISRRTGDRIGLVAFSARPYPVAPLTLDHDWLTRALERLEVGDMEDGTALGDGLLAAVNRLRASPAASRAVVLLTDGRSNAGATDPAVAAQAARTLGIRVHTIGVGSRGAADCPVEDPLGGISFREVRAELDEATLGEIARATGGGFFHATDAATLRQVFREIDLLERRTIEEKVSHSNRELFPALVLAALALLLVEATLRHTWLRRIP